MAEMNVVATAFLSTLSRIQQQFKFYSQCMDFSLGVSLSIYTENIMNGHWILSQQNP